MSEAMGYRRFLSLPPEELEVLRARAREAAQAAQVEEAGEREEVLVLHAGGQALALPLRAVEGVTEMSTLAAVPRAAPWVRGLVPFRGEVLLAVELAQLLGSRTGGIADLKRVVALSAGGRRVALLVERVSAVRSVSPADFRPDPLARRAYLVGTDSDFLSLLEPAGLLAAALAVEGAP
jgi:purine-binding chemotaxis protein CheW